VSFGAPLFLLALLLVPALAAGYVGLQRTQGRAAAAFASPALRASFAPHRPRWRRHVPLTVLLLAVAILVVALAKPQRTVAVPVEQAQIMLLNDVSGSMLATDVKPNRLVAARRAAQAFIDKVPKQVNIGVEAFNQIPQVLANPTTDRNALSGALGRLTASGGTATGEAIQTATRVLNQAPAQGGKKPPSAIVLLSDGASTKGVNPLEAAQAAAKLKIPIYTVTLGTAGGTITVPRSPKNPAAGTITKPVPPDEASLRQIATSSGGQSFTAESASDLSTVYERLGSQLGHKKEPRQITAGFAGAGLALLAFGAALSLRWTGRLI
jgi:Ca-activated chloride channel family protein